MFSSPRRFDRATALFVSLLAVAFIIATFDVRAEGGGAGGVLREGVQTLFGPVQEGVDYVTRPVVGFIDGVSNIAGLRDENERLQARVRELENQVRETTAMERRITELEGILALDPPQDLAAITARIYSGGPTAFDHIRYIDKGAEDGIVEGQAVIDEDGLVGRVDQVTKNRARIRLITDPLVSVSVRVQETNETGVITGQGSAPLRLDMFRASEPVREGDVVVTDGSRFPQGIVVGYVETTADIEVNFVLRTSVLPAVRMSQLDFVQVVVGWSPLDDEVEEPELPRVPPPIFEPGVDAQ